MYSNLWMFQSYHSAHPCLTASPITAGPGPAGALCANEWTYNGVTYFSCGAHGSAVKPYTPDGTLQPGTDRWCSLIPDYNATDPAKRDQWGYCKCLTAGVCGGINGTECAGAGESCQFQPGAFPADTGVCTTAKCPNDGCRVFFDGCNDCTCNGDGSYACTKKVCPTLGQARCKDPITTCPKGCRTWYDGCNTFSCHPNTLVISGTDKFCTKYKAPQCKDTYATCISGTTNACAKGFTCITADGAAPGSKGVCMADIPCYDEKKKIRDINKGFITYAVNYYKNILNADEQEIMMGLLHGDHH